MLRVKEQAHEHEPGVLVTLRNTNGQIMNSNLVKEIVL